MREQTIKLYQFNELDDKAKERAIDKFRYINVEGFEWYDWLYDEFTTEMRALGYLVEDIYFSGFSSQGDGACFTGEVAVYSWLKAHKLGNEYRKLLNFVSDIGGVIKIKHSGHYYHANSMGFIADDIFYDLQYQNDEQIGDQLDIVLDMIDDEAREKARKLYKRLENTYFDLLSDEVVVDSIHANEIEFLSSGKLPNY